MADVASQFSLSGQQRRAVVPALLKCIQIVSGYLVLRWILWLAARYLFGYKVESTVSVTNGRFLYQSRTQLLGREIRSSEEVFLQDDVIALGVENRFPHLVLLMGSLGLIVGSVYGITAVIDGIQASYLAISLVGFGIIAAGVIFDIGLGALAGYWGSQSALLVTVRRGKSRWFTSKFRVLGVEQSDARRFVAGMISRS